MPLPTTTPRTDPIFYDRNGPRTISSLYQEYHAKIKRRASLFVGEESAAEDITSITFFKVLRFAHTFKAGSNFNAWIYRIAGRVTIDYICERMQEPSFPYHPIEESTAGDSRKKYGPARSIRGAHAGERSRTFESHVTVIDFW